MAKKPTYEEIEQKVKELEKQVFELQGAEEQLSTAIEKALQESEEKYRNLFETSQDAIFITTREGTFVNSNQALLDLFGFTKEEIKDLKAQDFYNSSDERSIITQELGSRGFIRDYEIKFRKKNGERMDCIFSATVRKANDGSILGYQGTVRDITENKRMEQALSESEERYRVIFEQAADAIVLVDPSTGELVNFNDSAYKKLGYSLEEFKKLKVNDLDVIEDEKEVLWHGEKVIRKGEDIFETKKRTKSGKIRDYLVNAKTITLKERDYIHSIWYDITEHKQAEEALQRAKDELEAKTNKLEEINTALNILLEKREEDKIILQEQVLSNVKKLTLPYIEKLRKGTLNEMQQAFIDVIESSLHEIISPLAHKLTSDLFALTPTEIKVADIVRQGKRTKQIAKMLNLSPKTIERYREGIRNKLGIKNKKVNLQSHLNSLA